MDSQSPHHHLDNFLALLAQQPAVLVQVETAQGSVPRDAGTWMAVFASKLVGTIGGGQLEHEAMAKSRTLLEKQPLPTTPEVMRFALGPSLGQCCGGVASLRFERVQAQNVATLRARLQSAFTPVVLFGGGHVGHALVRVLSPLPFAVMWIDSRDGVFPADVPGHVYCEQSEPVEAAVHTLPPQSRVLIMSFSHAEDLQVLAMCLLRQRSKADLPYIGLIGSRTKWATFQRRLLARGFTPGELAHVTSPIGVPGISGKEPDVIAIAVAAQLLQSLPAQP